MIIFGAGPVGAELGQAFQRLGTNVTFIIRGDKFLPREDRDAANFLQKQMTADGVQFIFNTEAEEVFLIHKA
jgi:pyruvate/2-oxoglutarate dehydrogenase complex dihydrolipoamide dehydrogenase (E3) component